jgi:hypothetical protein
MYWFAFAFSKNYPFNAVGLIFQHPENREDP